MSRNDGRPRSIPKLKADPMPIRHLTRPYRYPDVETAARFTGDPVGGEMWEWDVRDGFLQNEEAYQ